MAEITNENFKELINATKETNDLLREDMIGESKPDPGRFMKEEAANILIAESNRRSSKELLDVEKKESQDLLKTEKTEKVEKEEKKKHELEWFKEQEKTTKEVAALANLYNVRSAATMGLIIAGPPEPDLADEEDEDEDEARDSKMLGYLKSTAGFLSDISKKGYEKVKSGLSGFKKFAFGALALAALAFLNDPRFTVIKNTILDLIIPALAYIYDEIVKPLAIAIGGRLKTLFKDLRAYIDGDKGLGSVIMENIVILAGIVGLLKPSLIMTPLFGAIKLFWGAMKKSYLAQLATNAAAGAGGQAGILGTVKALGTTFLKFAGIAALIYAAVVGIFQGAKDAFAEFDATGSIWESIKTFLASFIANFAGAILNPIKDGLSWIIEKIGSIFGIEAFADVSKAMDEFDFVDMFKKGLEWIGNWFDGMFDSMKQLAQTVLKKIPGGETLSNWIFGTKEEQEAEKKREEAEQKQFELNRQALREKQKLEKDSEEAKKLLAIKKKEHELMIQKSAPAAAKLNTTVGAAYGNMGFSTPPQIINAPTTSVNSSPTTNVTQQSKRLAPLDKVIDILTVSA
jgi:hypothetical protein